MGGCSCCGGGGSKAVFKCEVCGRVSAKQDKCCGKPMKKA